MKNNLAVLYKKRASAREPERESAGDDSKSGA